MAKKKTYYIPTLEILYVNTEEMMLGSMESGGHNSVGTAPRRDPAF